MLDGVCYVASRLRIILTARRIVWLCDIFDDSKQGCPSPIRTSRTLSKVRQCPLLPILLTSPIIPFILLYPLSSLPSSLTNFYSPKSASKYTQHHNYKEINTKKKWSEFQLDYTCTLRSIIYIGRIYVKTCSRSLPSVFYAPFVTAKREERVNFPNWVCGRRPSQKFSAYAT